MKNLQAVLQAARTNLEQVVQTTIFLKNIADFAAVNEVYGRYFTDSLPARSTVQVANLPREALAEIAGTGPYLFPSFKRVWETTLRKAGAPYFRLYDLRSTPATRLSAGGVADKWVAQSLRQGDATVFKKYSQMKLPTKREAPARLNRRANESSRRFGTVSDTLGAFGQSSSSVWAWKRLKNRSVSGATRRG